MFASKVKAQLINDQINSYNRQYFNLTNDIIELSEEDSIANAIEISLLEDRKQKVLNKISEFKMKYGNVT